MPWFDMAVPVKIVPAFSDRFMDDADVVMANHWPTAFSVAKLSPSKGRKFYFIRDTEFDERHREYAERSYNLPLSIIVTVPWLKDHLEQELDVKVAGIVPNGMNMDQFGVPEKKYNDVPVICMLYYDHPVKGMSDGFEAIAAVRERHPDVRVVLFGWNRPKTLPFEAEFHLRPVKEELRAIYARSDIFLSPSLQEGWNNPPLEAMAAGCAVVTTNVGGIPYRTIPGETALVVDPGDVEGMIRSMNGLIENPARLRELGCRGHEHLKQFTWEESASELARLLAE